NGAEGIIRTGGRLSDPFVFFGTSPSGASESEVELDFKQAATLYDVRMKPLRWVITRWVRRCGMTGTFSRTRTPALWFTPNFDQPLNGRMPICRTSEDVRLTWFERQVVRY